MKTRTSLILTLGLSLAGGCNKDKQDTATPEPVATTPTEPAPQPPAAKPIPEGYFTLTPMLRVKGVDAAVDFYTKAFGATKTFSMANAEGKTAHAEIKIGDSIIMIEEVDPKEGTKSALELGGTPATLMIYVSDADQVFAAATGAGARAEMPVDEQFWGDRYGQVIDPFGHRWAVATHVEDLTPEQMAERSKLAMTPPPPEKTGKKKKPAKKKDKAAAPPPPAWKAVVGKPASTPTPPQYHTVTVAYTVDDAAKAIEFYKAAFGATENDRMADPAGKIMHCELAIGNSVLMLSDEYPEMGAKSATTIGGTPVSLMMYTEDVDAAFAKATAAGAQT
ncbi:MAG TPA: VOC family protein, partial [Nannocystaceae bacterium]|nr:VOC family protein [Nannocystaceae bacterium]